MATSAKKKATPQDDRKPRPKSFAAFICAQPYDIPAREITRAARSSGYDVSSISAVEATRKSYPHLRFSAGDPPTQYVIEFLQSPVSRKAKNYTSANSSVEFDRSADDVKFIQNVLKGAAVKPVPSAKETKDKKRPFVDISAIVDSVLRPEEGEYRQARKSDPIDPGALWGRRADGTPRKKSGPKSSNGSVSVRERMASSDDLQTVIDVASEPVFVTPPPVEDPIAQFLEAVGETPELKSEPEPKAEINLAPEPDLKPENKSPTETEVKPGVVRRIPSHEPKAAPPSEDDVLLQKMRDGFEIGDYVQVTLNSRNGPFRLEGQIKDKKSKFAVVELPNNTTDMFPYKRLSLAPRMAGNGTANGNGVSSSKAKSLDISSKASPEPINDVKEEEASDLIDANGLTKGPLTAVPPAFSKLRAVAPISEPEKRKLKTNQTKEAPTVSEPVQAPAEAVAQARAAAETAPTPETVAPAAVVVTAEPVSSTPVKAPAKVEEMTDLTELIAWVEMGKPFYHLLPVYQAKLRTDAERKASEIDLLKQEIERLLGEREAAIKQASNLDGLITLMKTLGGEA